MDDPIPAGAIPIGVMDINNEDKVQFFLFGCNSHNELCLVTAELDAEFYKQEVSGD